MKKTIFVILAVVSVVTLTGCIDPLSTYEPVFDRFYSTTLKLSTSSDVLAMIQDPETEMTSQSNSVVASWGVDGKKDRTHWFNIVSFDEDQMNAVRKYGFILEEVNTGWNRQPGPVLRLDAGFIMGADILEAPYASNNEKRIEIIKAARDLFDQDCQEVILDAQSLRNSTMMVKQAFNSVFYKLNASPAYAAKLPLVEGLAFDHPTLGESYMRMLIEGDTVKIKIKCGKNWFRTEKFHEHPDVLYM